MKRVVETEELSGFDAMLGEKVCLYCGVYIYTGVLAGVNDDHVELAEPKLVYETGPHDSDEWQTAEALPSPWRVMLNSIESWGPAKC